MKNLLRTLFILTAALFAPSFLHAKDDGLSQETSRDEKTALEEFKKDFASFEAFAQEKKKATKMDEIPAAMKEMVAKLKAIKTDGLPADLKEPWLSAVKCTEKMTVLFHEMPAGGKLDAAKVHEIMTQMDTDQKKLAEAGEKYDIEGLGKLGD